MKNLIMLCAVAVLFVTACNQTTDTRSFIPGIYVNQSAGEYSIASDTLVIEASESNNYFIHRKTGFRRITDGKPGKREYETEEWNALYDQGTKSLTEMDKGKLLTFYPEANKLLVGKREYKKINK
ncbi:hypothetical protein AAKU52_003130 [Pedobacter sp. CG_S7]|uniref:hypothetical protein n=1 Tax=Pedobacter sp. CG_S7 TaxID=3143930 RepID=UPI0033994983